MSGECLSNGRDGTLATRSARNRKALATWQYTCSTVPVNVWPEPGWFAIAAEEVEGIQLLWPAPCATCWWPHTVALTVRPLVHDLHEAGAEMVLSGDKHF